MGGKNRQEVKNLKLFKRKKKESLTVQTAVSNGYQSNPFALLGRFGSGRCERKLYRALRENIPVVDAAIYKIIRLVGGFRVICDDAATEKQLSDFLDNVPVNGCQKGIRRFLENHLDRLITDGTAVGEIVLSGYGREIAGLYNASLDDVSLATGKDDPFHMVCYVTKPSGERVPVAYPDLLIISRLMTEPKQIYGTSVLRGLPFVGDLLMKILNATGTNWDRVGNVRFLVSYKPNENDRSFTKERASMIAEEWTRAMKSPEPKDFVTVGDVNVKVIGADNQIPDAQIPMRILLEQLIAKLSIPPFLLGLSWSSTERMSSQQADILTSELEYYRHQLSTAVRQVCDLWMKLHGHYGDYRIEWDNINLQDEVELARAALYRAQAQKLTAESSAHPM